MIFRQGVRAAGSPKRTSLANVFVVVAAHPISARLLSQMRIFEAKHVKVFVLVQSAKFRNDVFNIKKI